MGRRTLRAGCPQQPIACAANGVDEFVGRIAIDFSAQVIDVDLDDIRVRCGAKVPGLFEDLLARDVASCVSHEVFKKGVFLGGEMDGLAAAGNSAPGGIEFEILHAQDGGCGTAAAVQNGARAGEELLTRGDRAEGEVVRAHREEAHALFRLRPIDENENGELRPETTRVLQRDEGSGVIRTHVQEREIVFASFD